jgi:hypothetical protein
MLTQPGPYRPRPRLRRPAAAVLLLAAAVALSVAVSACFGDDEDDDAAPLTGSLVTVTAAPASASATSQPATSAGTLAPAATATPLPTVAVNPPVQSTAGVAAMLDMAPCAAVAHYQVQTFDNGVPALTYKDVPQGTPILFPFEEGTLRHVDARAGAIVLVYDVEGVGVFTVQSSGPNSLDPLVSHPVAGTVIGHFEGPFEKEATHAFEDYQLFAAASTTDVIVVGDQLYQGEALNLEVKDCIVLP